MKEAILKHYNALLEDVSNGEVCPFSALNEVSKLTFALQNIKTNLKNIAVQDKEFDTGKHLVSHKIWLDQKTNLVTRDKFVQIMQDAELFGYFNCEFGNASGESWEAKDLNSLGWFFDGFCIGFRERVPNYAKGSYNFKTVGSKGFRATVLAVLMAYGYEIGLNQDDGETGFLLLTLKDKYQ